MTANTDRKLTRKFPESIANRIERHIQKSTEIVVTMRSPDGTIHLTSGLNSPARISFSDDAFQDHTPKSTERQIAALLRAAVAARRVAYSKVSESLNEDDQQVDHK